MAREEGELGAALQRRVREAVARAQRTAARSRVLRSAALLRRDGDAMAKHCAWCGRVCLAEHWIPLEHAPRFITTALLERATHTICDECVQRLEASGQSVGR